MTLRAELIKCDCNVIHQDIVDHVKTKMPDQDSIQDLSQFFKIFGDSTRLKILSALFESEMCVCDMATLFNMTQSSISHQLSVLKQARMVKYRKDGKVVYYALDDHHIQHIFDQGLTHIKENRK
ncbi:MAG: putative transcriptional regulator [Erysipelotrichaceae bacterium]|nr:MAG: putative transcriptional [Erysipelotrichaceae bacterium]TXT18090.1 MAG: putative transcriptional regulator [Erysipelotrichaceae bacterium]